MGNKLFDKINSHRDTDEIHKEALKISDDIKSGKLKRDVNYYGELAEKSKRKTFYHHIKDSEVMKKEYPVRIMAQAEGYLMLRRKGCVPFIESEKVFKKYYKEITSEV